VAEEMRIREELFCENERTEMSTISGKNMVQIRWCPDRGWGNTWRCSLSVRPPTRNPTTDPPISTRV
jgi:hypothetical protein